jgi:hypothetical protein
MRSLLLLEEAAGMTALPPAAPLRGYAFVELAVAADAAAPVERLLIAMGFRHAGQPERSRCSSGATATHASSSTTTAAGRRGHGWRRSRSRALVGELSTQSEEFRTRWAAHNVRLHETGVKDYHHSVVGDLNLTYNRIELSADPGLAITVWTAEPGSKSGEALSLLGSWAATVEQANLAHASGSA